MRRLWSVALVAIAALLATSSMAFANHHNGPVHMGTLQTMSWEMNHFTTHLQLTFQAMQLMFVSPQLGWELLTSQTLCADQGSLTARLFDTGAHALMTALCVVLVALWLATKVVVAMWRYINRLFAQPRFKLA